MASNTDKNGNIIFDPTKKIKAEVGSDFIKRTEDEAKENLRRIVEVSQNSVKNNDGGEKSPIVKSVEELAEGIEHDYKIKKEAQKEKRMDEKPKVFSDMKEKISFKKIVEAVTWVSDSNTVPGVAYDSLSGIGNIVTTSMLAQETVNDVPLDSYNFKDGKQQVIKASAILLANLGSEVLQANYVDIISSKDDAKDAAPEIKEALVSGLIAYTGKVAQFVGVKAANKFLPEKVKNMKFYKTVLYGGTAVLVDEVTTVVLKRRATSLANKGRINEALVTAGVNKKRNSFSQKFARVGSMISAGIAQDIIASKARKAEKQTLIEVAPVSDDHYYEKKKPEPVIVPEIKVEKVLVPQEAVGFKTPVKQPKLVVKKDEKKTK